MTMVLAQRSVEFRTEGEKLIRQADKLLVESWKERMWADGDLRAEFDVVKLHPQFVEVNGAQLVVPTVTFDRKVPLQVRVDVDRQRGHP